MISATHNSCAYVMTQLKQAGECSHFTFFVFEKVYHKSLFELTYDKRK